MNSNRASTGTLNVDISPQQPNMVYNMTSNNPESLLENTTIPEINHHQSNMSLNQREEQVILPNPNHQLFGSRHVPINNHDDILNSGDAREESREKGVVVDVHRSGEDKPSLRDNPNSNRMDGNEGSHANNLHFDLNTQNKRNGNNFPHSAISKRISSSSSGGYSATDEVDYLKWVSETKGQIKHHINKKIGFATDGNFSERQDTNGNKSLNSSSSGVSSVESCPTDGVNSEPKTATCNSHSPSSGHGSQDDSGIANNMLSCNEKKC